jgi:GNAT superfamily N-acetyltransferase
LLGGILPDWRNQGIGQQLWRQTIGTAQDAGWQKLTIGPVWNETTAVTWLQNQNATPQQTYQLYERTF